MSGSAFKKGCHPEKILMAACKSRTINTDGSWISHDGGFGNRWGNIVSSYLLDDRHPIVKLSAVTKILNTKQNWKVSEFSRAYRKEIAILDGKLEDFIVAFPISGSPNLLGLTESFAAPEFKITYDPVTDAEKEIAKSRAALLNDRHFKKIFDTYLKFKKSAEVHIYVKALHSHHAQAISRDILDEVFGITVFLSNLTLSRDHIGLLLPVSQILVAPMTTVHKSDGSLTQETFWYDNWNGDPADSFLSLTDNAIVRDDIEKIRARINTSLWREDCQQAFRMFFQFASEPDRKASFLLGWQLLEFLVSGERQKGIHTDTDAILSRACRFYADYDLKLVQASYFKDARNAISHGHALPPFDDLGLLFQLKEFIRPILNHFVSNPFKFKNRCEFTDFCDAGNDPQGIKAKIELQERNLHVLGSALRFVSKTESVNPRLKE